MKILFIDGTKFVGRNIVELALAQNYEVHILQSGKINLNIFQTAKRYTAEVIIRYVAKELGYL